MAKRGSRRGKPREAQAARRDLYRGLYEAGKLMRSEKYLEARGALEELDRKSPDNEDVLRGLTEACHGLRDTHGYQHAVERLSKLAPDDRDVALGLAGAYMTNLKPTLALRGFRRFLERWPEDERARQVEERIATLKRIASERLSALSFSEDEFDELGAMHDETQVLMEYGQYAEARPVAEKLIERKPKFAAVRNNLSVIYALEGDLKSAIAAAHGTLEMEPHNYHALGNLVRFHVQSGQIEQARAYAERLKPIPDGAMVDIWLKKIEALSYLGAAVDKSPSHQVDSALLPNRSIEESSAMLRAGIVGLPNVGKSTLFNALTATRGAESASYPFSTTGANVGVVNLPDARLEPLAKIAKTNKIVYATVEFVDIAGLAKGASRGEGLGNQFLHHIRETELIVHVVRCFEDENVVHVEETINPRRDIETLNLELILADLATVEKRRERVTKQAKVGDKTAKEELELLDKLQAAFDDGKPARLAGLTDEEKAKAYHLFLLTMKPMIYVANVSESDLSKPETDFIRQVREHAESEGADSVVISAQLEADLVDLEAEERPEYLAGLGVTETGLGKLIRGAYHTLGLISFFTAGEKEARAWTIRKGAKAPEAAGEIHSDIERGFIRAQVIAYNHMIEAGSEVAAKEKGWMRLEGKEYAVQDGDVIEFRFNV